MKEIKKRVGRASTAAVAMGALMVSGLGTAALAAPGPGNIDPDLESSLTIHKYAGAPVEGAAADGSVVNGITNDPLEGVSFKACKVGTLSGDPETFTALDVHNPAQWADITELNAAIQASPTHALPSEYTLEADTECLTGTTDENGEIKWGDIDQAVYYVTETRAPATVAEHTLPFLVTVPMAHNSDNTWIYDVNVYPKNAVHEIEKEAVEMGPLGVGSKVDWNVTNTIPKAQENYTSYLLFDLLDDRLDYDTTGASTVVTLGGTALTPTTDYVVKVAGQGVRVELTAVGLGKLNAVVGKNGTADDAEIVWSFKTVVKSIGDGTIENSANVLTNQPGNTWGTDPDNPPTTPPPGVPSDKVDQTWGALKINKFESVNAATSGKALSDAKFQVFGTEAAANACVTAVETAKGTLPTGCENAISVSRDLTGGVVNPAQNIFTTDEDGVVTIPGLYVGTDEGPTTRTYYVVEIVPPAGFVNGNTVHNAVVSIGSTTTAVELDVPNAQEPPTTLPATGGKGTLILVISALAIGGVAVGVSLNGRRKNAVNA